MSGRMLYQAVGRSSAFRLNWTGSAIAVPPRGALRAHSRHPGSRPGRPLDALPRVVVDLEGFLLRALGLRHVVQVDADPRPGRASTSHRIHQDVGGLEVAPDVPVA